MNLNQKSEEVPLTEEEQKIQNGRLGTGEAMAYQGYATDLNRVDFSEQANKEDYEEAEKFLKPLMDTKFDFLGIDWSTFNFEIGDSKEMEDRLRAAIRKVLITTKVEEPDKYKKLLKKYDIEDDSKLQKITLKSLAAILYGFAFGADLVMFGGSASEAAQNLVKKVEMPSDTKLVNKLSESAL